jgi:hypothetical protein
VPKPDVALVVRLRGVEKIHPLGLVEDGLRVASLGLLVQLLQGDELRNLLLRLVLGGAAAW